MHNNNNSEWTLTKLNGMCLFVCLSLYSGFHIIDDAKKWQQQQRPICLCFFLYNDVFQCELKKHFYIELVWLIVNACACEAFVLVW